MGKSEADYLEELIAFRSVSADKEASKECAEFCAGFFEGLGMHTKVIESGGYPNVVATTTTTKKPMAIPVNVSSSITPCCQPSGSETIPANMIPPKTANRM